jgi:hypothetical protein
MFLKFEYNSNCTPKDYREEKSVVKRNFVKSLPSHAVGEWIHTYIHTTHALSPKGRGIWDIPPRHPRFTKIGSYEEHCRRDRWKVFLESISGVIAINPLVAWWIKIRFYVGLSIGPLKKERSAILLFCPGRHTRLWLCRMYLSKNIFN